MGRIKNSKHKQKIRRNITLFPYYNFFRRFQVESVIIIIYFALVLDSYTKAMSLVSIYSISVCFLEIPAGVFSDKVGRRLTLTISPIFGFLMYILLILGGLNKSYILFALSSICFGMKAALNSGTDKALIFETLAELKKKNKFHNAYGKIGSISEMSLGVSALIGGIIATKSFITVFVIGAFVQFCCMMLGLFFVEPKEIERSKDNPFKLFKDALKIMILTKKLRNMSIAKVTFMSNSLTSHTIQPLFLKVFVPLWVLGFTRTLKHTTGFFGFWFSGKIIDKISHIRSLVSGICAMSSINLLAVFISSVITPFLMSFSNFFYGLQETSRISLFQMEFTDKQRATMESIISMLSNVSFAIMSLIGGYIADLVSPKFAIILLEIFVLSSAILYYRALKK
ncbi:MFS transporter [Pseudomonadota bacterium]